MTIDASVSKGTVARWIAPTLAWALPLLASTMVWAAGPPSVSNSGPGRYKKTETEVAATQTNLTKPEAPPPPKKETGPVVTVDQFVESKQSQLQTLVDK